MDGRDRLPCPFSGNSGSSAMEVDVKELSTKGKECVRLADGKKGADECNHFTIRGYVAGVRKRDARICWPLFMPNNESSDVPPTCYHHCMFLTSNDGVA
ncbi:embryonic flower 1 [Musa troglodytarum]|uniref:Embryonic flower 1 n=1 Tax=Musa troglodytarum TaxID=320322 RepID=A0A9E7L0V9_9LILI|nr:embryonic flower 1 [Musa troglodytarum]